MLCPSCQLEVPESHFYCPNCRVSVLDYTREVSKQKSGKIKKIGLVLRDLLALALFIGGAIVLARQINWKELYQTLQQVTGISLPAPPTNAEQSPPSSVPTKRRPANAVSSKPVGEKKESDKPLAVENPSQPLHKNEEPLPSDSKPTPTPPKP